MKYKVFFCGELDHEFSDKDQEEMNFMQQELASLTNDGIWEFEDEEGHTMFPTYTQSDNYSSGYGDYSPNNPWNAPGMSVSDFI